MESRMPAAIFLSILLIFWLTLLIYPMILVRIYVWAYKLIYRPIFGEDEHYSNLVRQVEQTPEAYISQSRPFLLMIRLGSVASMVVTGLALYLFVIRP